MGRGHGSTRAGGSGGAVSSRGYDLTNPSSISTKDLLNDANFANNPFANAIRTQELNRRLEVKKIENLVFETNEGGIYAKKGFALHIEGAGYVKFNSSSEVYASTKGALSAVKNGGGFTDYKSLEFINPVGTIDHLGQFNRYK